MTRTTGDIIDSMYQYQKDQEEEDHKRQSKFVTWFGCILFVGLSVGGAILFSNGYNSGMTHPYTCRPTANATTWTEYPCVVGTCYIAHHIYELPRSNTPKEDWELVVISTDQRLSRHNVTSIVACGYTRGGNFEVCSNSLRFGAPLEDEPNCKNNERANFRLGMGATLMAIPGIALLVACCWICLIFCSRQSRTNRVETKRLRKDDGGAVVYEGSAIV